MVTQVANSTPHDHQLQYVPAEKVSHDSSQSVATTTSKPFLPPPKMSLFALYYILDKMGLASECQSWSLNKQEITENDKETTAVHKKFLEELKVAMAKEEETERWGVMVKAFSWIGSFLAMITGAFLIATGVGAVAGALLIVGGLINIGSQIMEIAGGWKKIVELLPGDDSEKKRATIAWMQIGITLLSLIISGAGVVFGGFAQVGQGMSTAMACVGAVATAAGGATQIGFGETQKQYYDARAEAQKYEVILARLKHTKQDLMEPVEDAPDRLAKIFQSLTETMGFEREINNAFQKAWR